jgi:hypothetical protein
LRIDLCRPQSIRTLCCTPPSVVRRWGHWYRIVCSSGRLAHAATQREEREGRNSGSGRRRKGLPTRDERRTLGFLAVSRGQRRLLAMSRTRSSLKRLTPCFWWPTLPREASGNLALALRPGKDETFLAARVEFIRSARKSLGFEQEEGMLN